MADFRGEAHEAQGSLADDAEQAIVGSDAGGGGCHPLGLACCNFALLHDPAQVA